MKHLHICTGANYVTVNGYIKLINSSFNNEDHLFIIRDNVTNPLQQVSGYENVRFMPRAENEDFKELLSMMKEAGHIWFHSMGWNWHTQLKLLMHPAIMKKSSWVEWGADLYDWKRTEGRKLNVWLTNTVMKRWRQKVSSVVAIFPADEKVIHREFGDKVKVIHAIYSIYYHESLDENKPHSLKMNDSYNILVGHSAVRNCHHFECFDALSKFKNENIMLHIPLTYGDMDYAKEVQEYARKIFPEEKLHFIMENIPLDDYVKFLWQIDAGVFKCYRQIALGNICKLLYMCKKVWLPKGSLMHDCFTEKETEIYDFDDIPSLTFEEFSKPALSTEPSAYMQGRMIKENVVKQWDDAFEGRW